MLTCHLVDTFRDCSICHLSEYIELAVIEYLDDHKGDVSQCKDSVSNQLLIQIFFDFLWMTFRQIYLRNFSIIVVLNEILYICFPDLYGCCPCLFIAYDVSDVIPSFMLSQITVSFVKISFSQFYWRQITDYS